MFYINNIRASSELPVERTSCLGVGGTEKGGALDLWFCSKSKVAGRSRFRDHVGVEDMQGGCGGCSLAYSLCCEVVCKHGGFVAARG